MATLPNLTFPTAPPGLATQLQQNAQATSDALADRVIGRVQRVVQYSATGATTTKITLPARNGYTAYAVLLVKVNASGDPGTDISATGRPNFTQPNGSTLAVYEPSGLTANTLYDLTFLVLETGGA